jgi:hypothetical protein
MKGSDPFILKRKKWQFAFNKVCEVLECAFWHLKKIRLQFTNKLFLLLF